MTEETFPFREIIKRDGRVVEFYPEKITQAIYKAARAVGGDNYRLAEELTAEVILFLKQEMIPGLKPTVEEIQDAVEKVLIERGHARTAKAYILYRDKRTRIREKKSELMDVVKDILLEGGRIEEDDSGHAPALKMHQIATTASEKYYLENLLPEELSRAHRTGQLYIHDLGYYSKTVDSFQLDFTAKLAQECRSDCAHGFPGSALPGVLFNLAALIQRGKNDLFGELSLPAFDTRLAQAMQRLERKPAPEEISGALQGFVSYLRELPASPNGHLMKCSLQIGLDTSEEGRDVSRSIIQHLLSCRLPASQWPRLLFILREDVNLSPGSPNYDLFRTALQAARFHKNIALLFLDNLANDHVSAPTPLSFSSGLRVWEDRHGSPGGLHRGNIAAVTLNLPRLALSTGETAVFFIELDRLLRLGIRQLLHRYEVLAVLKCRDLPFLMGEGLYRGSASLGPGDPIQEALKHGLLTMNFTGLPEAVRCLLGERARDHGAVLHLVSEIAQHMRRRVEMFAREYEMNIVLSGALTGLQLRELTAKDRREFGLLPGITDRELYSSSFFLFQEDSSLPEKMEIDGVLQQACPAGYSSRLFLLPGSEPAGVEELLLQLKEKGLGHVTVHALSRDTFP